PLPSNSAILHSFRSRHCAPETLFRVTCPTFCTKTNERVYITARACELGFGGTKGLQAAGAGGLREAFSLRQAVMFFQSVVGTPWRESCGSCVSGSWCGIGGRQFLY